MRLGLLLLLVLFLLLPLLYRLFSARVLTAATALAAAFCFSSSSRIKAAPASCFLHFSLLLASLLPASPPE